MMNKAIIVFLLVMGAGCRVAGPDRGLRTCPTCTAPAPPWITNKSEASTRSISVPPGETATIDGPSSIYRIIVGSGARVEAKSLEEVSGLIIVVNGATLIAPRLKSCGTLVVGKGAEVRVPELLRAEHVMVGTQIRVASLPDVGSWPSYGEDAVLVEPMLESGVGSAGDKVALVEAQALARVTNMIAMGDGAILIAPSLQSCGGARLGTQTKFEAPCAANTVARPRRSTTP